MFTFLFPYQYSTIYTLLTVFAFYFPLIMKNALEKKEEEKIFCLVKKGCERMYIVPPGELIST